MIDEKWLRYEAMLLSRREGIAMDEAYEQVRNDPALGMADEFVSCPTCSAAVKGRNLKAHMKKHSFSPKIKWGQIPIIKQQREKNKQLKKLVRKPQTQIVSGGIPTLGKKR